MDAYSPITVEIRLSLPLNAKLYTTTREISPRKPTPEIGATMESELGALWADSRIVAVSKAPTSPHSQLQITHARVPSEAEQLSSNWEYATASMGGQTYNTVVRTVVLLASEVAHDTPALGSAMPHESGSIFTGQDYILMDRQTVSGSQLDPVFRTERRTYMRRCTITQLGIDSLNGKALTSAETLHYATEIVTDGKTAAELFALPNHSYWGIQSNGTQRSGRQLSCAWYSVSTETIIGGSFNNGVVQVDIYTTNKDYYWPPVFESIDLHKWGRRDGGMETYPAVKFLKEGYRGDCAATITRTWSKSPFLIPVVEQMQPNSINIACPYFRINVPECLHSFVYLTITTGNNDPDYVYSVYTENWPATNFTHWPSSIVAYDDQQPYRGGYLRERIEIKSPTVT